MTLPHRADGPGAIEVRVSAAGLGPVARLRAAVLAALTRRRNRHARRLLEGHAVLWSLMQEAARGTAVTGASHSDYWTLYEEVRRHRPIEILELGTGISTVVLAQALRENEAEGRPRGRITSMEEDAGWAQTAGERLPAVLRPYVEIRHSQKIDGFYRIFRGVQ